MFILMQEKDLLLPPLCVFAMLSCARYCLSQSLAVTANLKAYASLHIVWTALPFDRLNHLYFLLGSSRPAPISLTDLHLSKKYKKSLTLNPRLFFFCLSLKLGLDLEKGRSNLLLRWL